VLIVDTPLVPTGYERTLPPGVQATVRARRRAAAGRATGRVLDLGGSEAHRRLWRSTDVDVTLLNGSGDPAVRRLAEEDARFDTVFSVFQLASAPDLAATLARLARVLAPGGRLLFLEPGRLAGMAGRTQRLLAPAMAATAGWRLDRDVPMAVRRAGLTITDLDRHRVATTQWWLRSLVEGTAHHALDAVGR
jgi:SAM-dependent methyltransferase